MTESTAQASIHPHVSGCRCGSPWVDDDDDKLAEQFGTDLDLRDDDDVPHHNAAADEEKPRPPLADENDVDWAPRRLSQCAARRRNTSENATSPSEPPGFDDDDATAKTASTAAAASTMEGITVFCTLVGGESAPLKCWPSTTTVDDFAGLVLSIPQVAKMSADERAALAFSHGGAIMERGTGRTLLSYGVVEFSTISVTMSTFGG